MPKRTLRSYNIRGQGGDLMDVAWRAVHAGAMEWEDVRAVQATLMPDCCACGARYAGTILMEKRGYCVECFRAFVAARMEGRE